MMNQFSLALAQTNPTVGDFAGNAARMLEYAVQAADMGADLVLYPEMALVGYPPEDLVLVSAFREQALKAAHTLAAQARDLPCDLIFGGIWEEGGHIYNASLLASGGELRVLRTKHDLPNTGVFDEKRVFAAGPEPTIVDWRGVKLGLLICEEVWDAKAPPRLAAQGAELLLVQNASPYHIGKAGQRKQLMDAVTATTGIPFVYLNMVGGQDELVFDGRSYVANAGAPDASRLEAFREQLGMTRWEKRENAWVCVGGPMAQTRADEETIYNALVLGLRDYVRKNGFPGVVLGLSGGIDSGLTAAIAADALGAGQVLTIRLPSPYSSVDTMEDAEQIAAALGLRMETIAITPAMEAVNAALAPLFAGRAVDTTEENIQARLRGLLLMAASNKFGPMVLTTGNKSEMSVGYATLYGDMCGGFSVLKDVYKTTVTKLSHWRNTLDAAALAELGFHGAAGPVIPERMVVKPPTAELRPNQKDEDSLPPYAVLDMILRGLVERRLSVRELVEEGMDRAMVEKVAQLVWAAEYKRRQSAPGVKITPMAFGRDRRWPITNRWRFA